MEAAVNHFISGTFAALTAKLASSIDDVVWLAAFLTPNLSPKERYANAITYASVCFFQTILAYIISRGGEAAIDKLIRVAVSGSEEDNSGPIISSEKVLTLFAGSALFIYSIKLAIEYYHEEILGEDDDDDDEEVGIGEKKGGYGKVQTEVLGYPSNGEEKKEESGEANKEGDEVAVVAKTKNYLEGIDDVPLLSESKDGDKEDTDADVENVDNEEKFESSGKIEPFEIEDENETSKSCLSARSRTLPIVAFLGSLDDLTLFVPMLVGKTFGIIELIIGSTVAGTIIVLICLFINKCEMVSNFLQRIPLAVIVIIFATVLLAKGLIME